MVGSSCCVPFVGSGVTILVDSGTGSPWFFVGSDSWVPFVWYRAKFFVGSGFRGPVVSSVCLMGSNVSSVPLVGWGFPGFCEGSDSWVSLIGADVGFLVGTQS